jgi:hypothetical protein
MILEVLPRSSWPERQVMVDRVQAELASVR